MFKLLRGYTLKNKSKFLIMVIAVALSVMVIFANGVSKKSQAKFTVDTIYNQSPSFQASIDNMSLEAFKKIKNNKNIKSYILIKSFGDVSYENQDYIFEEYNKEYFDSYKANIVKGNVPKNENEIIVNKSFIDKLDKNDDSNEINNFIGKKISMKFVKKYQDKDNSQQILDEKRDFKIVGVYDTPKLMKSYIDFNSIMVYKDFKFKDDAITYNGSINLKTGFKQFEDKVAELSYDLDETREVIKANESLSRALLENQTLSSEYDDFDKATIIASAFLIFNVFNIMVKDMIRELGMMRIVGMSKKHSLIFFTIKNLLILVIGSMIGLIAGYFLSGILIHNFTLIATLIDAKSAPIYIDDMIIRKTLITVTLTVVVSTIIPIMTTIISSPIEMLNGTVSLKYFKISNFIKKIKINNRNKNKEKILKRSVSTTIAINNTKKNALFVITTAIIIGMVGVSIVGIYVDNESTLFKDNPLMLSLNGYDIDLKYNGSSYSTSSGFKDSDLDKIASIDGVKDIYTFKNQEGYINLKGNELTDFYRNMNYIKNNDNTADYRLDVLTIQQKDMKKHEREHKGLLEEGRVFNPKSDILEVLVYNKFDDKGNTSEQQAFIKDLKINDTIDIKVPIEKNNHLEYKMIKAKVVGFMGDEWDNLSETEHFVPDIVFDSDDYSQITGVSSYDKIKIKIDEGKEKEVQTKVKNLFGNNSSYTYNDKQTVYDEITQLRDQFIIKKLMQSFLLVVTAVINIFFSIITSIVVRKRQFAMMRSVGLSLKDLKKILLKEGFIYGIVSSIFGFVMIFIYGIELCNLQRMMALAKNIEYTGSWCIVPKIPTLTFIILTILLCCLSVTLTFKRLDKLNIIDGMKDE